MSDVVKDPKDHLHRFGISDFRPGQREVVEAVLEGQDCLCIMPTGGGKSLCYQLPSVMREGVTLVVSPLIALMKDQVDSLKLHGISASFINSTIDKVDQGQRLAQLAAGEFDLMYVAPERFRSPRFQEAIAQTTVQLLAIDEAHCISEWGHDFRHDYTRIGSFRKKIGNPQTIALTATATDDVRKDVVAQLDLNNPKTFIAGFARPNLHYRVETHSTHREKIDALRQFLRNTPGCGVIYASTRKGCEEIAESIGSAHKRRVVVYHGGMAMDDRRRVQETFMSGKAEIVVATNAFGMGIDKSDVRFVVHFNIPGTLEAYYQEAGRAGRDGKSSECLLMYSPQDRYIQEFFIDSANPAAETIHAVYEFLRFHESDPIELTQDELKEEVNLSIGAEGVGTCERVLEKSGVLERLEPNRNMAAVRISTDVPTIADLIPSRQRNRRKVAKALEGIVGQRRHELVYFRPADLAKSLGMGMAKLTRTIREVCELDSVDYVPPFRGRAVRMIRRDLEFDQLEIDFAEIEARRKANFDKLDKVINFATTTNCRQQQVLTYFGERTSEPCGNCDNCSRFGLSSSEPSARNVPELDEAVLKVLSGVARSRGRFGKTIVAQMLTGSQAAKMAKYHLDQLSTFGVLSEFKQAEVAQLIDGTINVGLVEQSNVDRYRPVLSITRRGSQVMKQLVPVPAVNLPKSLMAKFLSKSKKDKPNDQQPSHENVSNQTTVEELPEPEAPVEPRSHFVTPDDLTAVRAVHAVVSEAANSTAKTDASAVSADRADIDDSPTVIRSDQAHQVMPPPAQLGIDAIVSSDRRPTHYWTWRLLTDGYTLEECSLIRGVNRSTLLDHVRRSIDDGRRIKMEWLFCPSQLTAIREAASLVGISGALSVRSLRGELSDQFSYEELELFVKCHADSRSA